MAFKPAFSFFDLATRSEIPSVEHVVRDLKRRIVLQHGAEVLYDATGGVVVGEAVAQAQHLCEQSAAAQPDVNALLAAMKAAPEGNRVMVDSYSTLEAKRE